MTVQQLRDLRNTVPAVADRVDIMGIKIDLDAPAAQRAEQYLRQVKNPYAFRCGDIAVNVMFNPTGKSLKAALTSYLTALKNNT